MTKIINMIEVMYEKSVHISATHVERYREGPNLSTALNKFRPKLIPSWT